VGESLLCGTPVVAFPVGNVPDLVEHKKNGYIASYENTRDLAEGIRWVTEGMSRQDFLKMSINCRLVAANYHDPSTAAERHISVYQKMLRSEN
jgi:glycosyltransferase involved in cell wall biosynthesis